MQQSGGRGHGAVRVSAQAAAVTAAAGGGIREGAVTFPTDEGQRRHAEGDERASLDRLFLAFVDQAASANSNRGCFLTNTALELSAHDPDAGRIVARGLADVEAFFLRLIQKGKAAGDIPRHVKAVETARGLLVLVRSRPEPTLLKSIVDDAMRRLA